MKNKVDLVYSLFDRNIVLSSKLTINAIQGYSCVQKKEVLSPEDIVEHFKNSGIKTTYLNPSMLWVYANPLTGEQWFINDFMGAYKAKEHFPINIEIIYNGAVALVTSLKKMGEMWSKFFPADTIKVVSRIGVLSYPDKVTEINYVPQGIQSVKLPVVV